MKLYLKAFARMFGELRALFFIGGLIAAGQLFGGAGLLTFLLGWLLGNTYRNKVAELKAEKRKVESQWLRK